MWCWQLTAVPASCCRPTRKAGENLWRTERPDGIAWSTPAVCRHRGQEIILAGGGDRLDAFHSGDGRLIWSLDGLEGNRVPSPTPFPGGAIVGSSKKGHNLAVRFPGEGEAKPSIMWRAANATTYFCSPLIYRDQAYFVNKAGVAYCLNLATGEELWTRRLQGQNWVSPIGAGDQVYFFSMKRGTDVLRASNRFEKLAENPRLADGRLYGVAAADSSFLIRYGERLIKITRS